MDAGNWASRMEIIPLGREPGTSFSEFYSENNFEILAFKFLFYFIVAS